VNAPTQVLVLGGGYTAVWAARALARGLRRELRAGDVVVTVVSATTAHAFHGWTGEVLAGQVAHSRTRTELVDLLPPSWVLHGRATEVDTAARLVNVLTADGLRRLPYDHLLVATGSRDARERVPGLAGHGWSLKEHEGLAALARRLDDLVHHDGPASVAVVGSGLAGVEAAAAVATRLRSSAAQVVLVDSGTRPLRELRPRFDRVADYAVREARQLGVEVRSGHRACAVDAAGVLLDDGSRVNADVVVSAVGQAVVRLPGLDAERGGDGRLVTDRFLRTTCDRVLAGGDGAAVPQPGGSGPCPPNALWAIKHGTRAGRNLVRAVRGRRLRPFRFPGLGQAVSLGVGRGAAELYGVQLTGWPAWCTRWFVFHLFMPSRRVALAAAGDWWLLARRRGVLGPPRRDGADPGPAQVAVRT